MTKMIFGTVVAVEIVSGAIGIAAGAWTYNAVRTAQASIFTPAEARLPGANDAPAIESGNDPQARPRNSHIGNPPCQTDRAGCGCLNRFSASLSGVLCRG
jgi:hypothetical protein